jgi:hypothetical protein
VKADGNGDFVEFKHGVNHSSDGFEAAHVLSRALGNAEDYRRALFLRGLEDCLRPF